MGDVSYGWHEPGRPPSRFIPQEPSPDDFWYLPPLDRPPPSEAKDKVEGAGEDEGASNEAADKFVLLPPLPYQYQTAVEWHGMTALQEFDIEAPAWIKGIATTVSAFVIGALLSFSQGMENGGDPRAFIAGRIARISALAVAVGISYLGLEGPAIAAPAQTHNFKKVNADVYKCWANWYCDLGVH